LVNVTFAVFAGWYLEARLYFDPRDAPEKAEDGWEQAI
jgi:hypothetical protein